MKILLLEDDYLYKVTIKDYLIDSGYIVDDFENGEDALDAIFKNHYDVLLLDIRVPGISGYEILKQIREYDVATPAIILTSLTDIENLSKGYELGCDDFLRKPFELKELKYRLKHAIKAQSFLSNKDYVQIDKNYKYIIHDELLLKNEKAIELSAIEIKLVSFLVKNIGKYLSLSILRDHVWDGKDITYADIRMCIKRVREKTDSNFIKTKKMVGYKIG